MTEDEKKYNEFIDKVSELSAAGKEIDYRYYTDYLSEKECCYLFYPSYTIEVFWDTKISGVGGIYYVEFKDEKFYNKAVGTLKTLKKLKGEE